MYNHTFTFKSLLVTLADSLQAEALLCCVTSQVIHPLNVLTTGGLGTGNNQLAHHTGLGPAVVSVESDHHLVLLALFDVLALLGEVEAGLSTWKVKAVCWWNTLRNGIEVVEPALMG